MFWDIMERKLLLHPSSHISDESRELSYHEFYNKVEALSQKLSLPPFTKCGVLCKSQLNTAIALSACWKARLVPIPMSYQYGFHHCCNIIALTTPPLILTDEIVEELKSELFKPFPFVLYQMDESEPVKLLGEVQSEQELLGAAAILCTSGTTGLPKGVVITETGLAANVQDIAEYFQIDSSDSILISRPLYHCAVLTGEFLISMYQGVSIRFHNGKYNPLLLLKSLNLVTTLCGTPTMFYQLSLILAERSAACRLKNLVLSGERLTENVGATIRNAFSDSRIYSVYGLTEAAPRVAFLEPDLFDKKIGSIGSPLRSVQIKVLKPDGLPCRRNEDGRLWVKGPNVMKGYYKDPELTGRTLQNGWLCTGDIASFDEDGLLYIKSRADNMIIKAGMNIYPEEIENLLKSHPDIKNALAYKHRSELTDLIYMDVVLSENSKSQTVKEIRQLCITLLPRHMWPDEIKIVDNLKQNASGKTMRDSS